MSNGSLDQSADLNRNLIALVLIQLALWICSVSAAVWWGYIDRERSDLVRDYHLVYVESSRQLMDHATAIQRLTTDEKDLVVMIQGIVDHLQNSDETISRVSSLRRELGGEYDAAFRNLTSAMSEFRHVLQDGNAGPAQFRQHAVHLSLRSKQLERLANKQYDKSVHDVLDNRFREQVALVITLCLLLLIALVFTIVVFRQIRGLNTALGESTSQLSNATRIAHLGYSRWTTDGQCVDESAEFLSIFGLTADVFHKRYRDAERFRALIHPDDVGRFTRSSDHDQIAEMSYRILTPEGELRHVREVMEPLVDGSVMVVTSDISQLKRAEEQLVQSQKMEIVGQLTGGVAHDFNNILSVVMGSLELMNADQLDPTQQELVDMARRASERGSTLTSQLLAFARRQPLKPANVELHKLFARLEGLFRRTLGEDVDIEIIGTPRCWPCLVDPHQMETALFNLVLNARDAMPEGGRLTIEMSNVDISEDYATSQLELSPGNYVMIAISDTGIGIPDDLCDRIFEPFYTTKDAGSGTGLGLSMVYGFVKQSSGHITVYSELGEGTTFKLYLPRSFDDEVASPPIDVSPRSPVAKSRVVLIVEDEPDVLQLVIRQVKRIGYEVHFAASGAEALEILQEHDIDILLTDLVLPRGMNGKVLAEAALKEKPDLNVLFMSGYTRNSVLHHGRLEPGVALLQKPFSFYELQRALDTI